MGEKGKTITPSEIIFVHNDGPPAIIDREAINRGIKAHQKITSEIVGGIIPRGLREIGINTGPIARERRVSSMIGPNGLRLNAQCDLMGQRVIIELKPGKEILGRHLLQAAIGVVASGEEKDAIVYLYNCDKAFFIGRERIAECRSRIIDIAREARIILDNQERVDELKNNPPPRKRLTGLNTLAFETEWIGGDVNERMRLGKEAVQARKQFDQNIGAVMRILNPNRK